MLDFNKLYKPTPIKDFCKEDCMSGRLRVLPGNYSNESIGLAHHIGHIDRTWQVTLQLGVELYDPHKEYTYAKWILPLTYDMHGKPYEPCREGLGISAAATFKIAGLLNSIHNLEANDFSYPAIEKRRLLHFNELDNRDVLVEVAHVDGSDMAKVRHWLAPGWAQYPHAVHNLNLYFYSA